MSGVFVLDVRNDLDRLLADVEAAGMERIPSITRVALTWTAKDIEAIEVEAMRGIFDRPTPFTLRSLYVKPATKTDPIAFVSFREGFNSVPAWRYLGPEIEGGGRVKKSHERALERAGILRADEYCVPGKGAVLDAYGNMRGGDLSRILSQLKASPDPLQNASNSARSERTRKRHGSYFVLRGKGRDGVYLRRGRDIVPVLRFVRAPQYTAVYPFYGLAAHTYEVRFAANFQRAWNTYRVNLKQAA